MIRVCLDRHHFYHGNTSNFPILLIKIHLAILYLIITIHCNIWYNIWFNLITNVDNFFFKFFLYEKS